MSSRILNRKNTIVVLMSFIMASMGVLSPMTAWADEKPVSENAVSEEGKSISENEQENSEKLSENTGILSSEDNSVSKDDIPKEVMQVMALVNSDEEYCGGSEIPVKQICIGVNLTAVIDNNNDLWIWGTDSTIENNKGTWDSYGESYGYKYIISEDGVIQRSDIPVRLMKNIKKVCLGESHFAVIDTDDKLWMWGMDDWGQLGVSRGMDYEDNKWIIFRNTPVMVLENIKDVSLGSDYTGAIDNDGKLWMWGRDDYGQLGDEWDGDVLHKQCMVAPFNMNDGFEYRYHNGQTFSYEYPLKNIRFKSVHLGGTCSMAIDTDNNLWAWGGKQTQDPEEVKPRIIAENITSVEIRNDFLKETFAAIDTAGDLWMWGYNGDDILLGNGQPGSYSLEVENKCRILQNVKSVKFGQSHAGAVDTSGNLWMWGEGDSGKLGDGRDWYYGRYEGWDTYSPMKPTSKKPKIVKTGIKELDLGYSHSGAIDTAGNLWMWGDDKKGQLGNDMSKFNPKYIDWGETYEKWLDYYADSPERVNHPEEWFSPDMHEENRIQGWLTYKWPIKVSLQGSYVTKSISLNESVIRLNVGEAYTLIPTATKRNGEAVDEKNIGWSGKKGEIGWGEPNESDEYIHATVSEGVVKAKYEGEADIYAFSDGVKTKCHIIVGRQYNYGVIFNSNGGSEVPSQSLKYGSKVTKPADPTKEGATFEGWYKNESLTRKWDFDNDTITGITTLYAKWSELNKVTFTDGYSIVSQCNVKSGEKITAPNLSERDGYTFDGWYYNDNGVEKKWDFDVDTINTDLTLFAKWNKYPGFTIGRDTNWWGHWNGETYGMQGRKNYQFDVDADGDWYFKKLCDWLRLLFNNSSYNRSYDSYMSNIQSNIAKGWGGSCYGIAASMGKLYNGDNDISEYTDSSEGKDFYYDLDRPADNINDKLWNVINYYFLSQFIPVEENYIWSNGSEEFCSAWLKEFTDSLNEKNNNIEDNVCIFSFKNKDMENGHAILALNKEIPGDGYIHVNLYDMNKKEKTDKQPELTIKDDYSDFLLYYGPSDRHNTDKENFNYLSTTSMNSLLSLSDDPASTTSIVNNVMGQTETDMIAFSEYGTITNAEGKTLSYNVNGVSGNIEIKDSDYIVSDGVEGKSTYRVFVKPSSSYTLSRGNYTGNLDVSIGGKNGYYSVKGDSKLNGADISFADGIKLKGSDYSFTAFAQTDNRIGNTQCKGLASISGKASGNVTVIKQGETVTASSDGIITNATTSTYIDGYIGTNTADDSNVITTDTRKVVKVSLDQKEKTISVGDTFTLTASVLPSEAVNKSVSWNSNNPEVVTVTDKGVVKGLAEGEAVIKVTTDDGGHTDTCKVKVVKASDEDNPTDPDKEGIEKGDLPEGTAAPEGIWVGGLKKNYPYTGNAIKPVIRVYKGETRLTADTDYTLSYKNNTNVGTNATITVKLKGDYSGSKPITFAIEKNPLTDVSWEEDQLTVPYKKNKKHNNIKPVLTMNGVKLKYSAKDFDIKYLDAKTKQESSCIDVGDYLVSMSAKSDSKGYKGSIDIPFVVTDKPTMGEVKITPSKKNLPYNGTKQIPDFTLKYKGQAVNSGAYTMLTVSGDSYIEPGSHSVLFKGNGKDYIGSRKFTYKITGKRSLEDSNVTAVLMPSSLDGEGKVPYAYGGAKPKVIISYNGTRLKEGTHYTLSYKNNKKAGQTGTVTIKGKGSYKGSKPLTFTVSQRDLKTLLLNVNDRAASARANDYKKAPILFTDKDFIDQKLKANTDYTAVFTVSSENAAPIAGDIVTVDIEAKSGGNYKGTATTTFKIIEKSKDLSRAKVKINGNKAFEYTGKQIKPSGNEIQVTLDGKTVNSSDYDISAYYNNVKRGNNAVVIITGKGELKGSKAVKFKIASKPVDRLWNGAIVFNLFSFLKGERNEPSREVEVIGRKIGCKPDNRVELLIV